VKFLSLGNLSSDAESKSVESVILFSGILIIAHEAGWIPIPMLSRSAFIAINIVLPVPQNGSTTSTKLIISLDVKMKRLAYERLIG